MHAFQIGSGDDAEQGLEARTPATQDPEVHYPFPSSMLDLCPVLTLTSVRVALAETNASPAEQLLAMVVVAGLGWLVWKIVSKGEELDGKEQADFERRIQSASEWRAEKKQFRALHADPQAWEDWLDRGQMLAASLKDAGVSDKGRLAALAQMRETIVNDLRVYESARAVVAMQSGAGNSPSIGQGTTDTDATATGGSQSSS